MTSLHQYSKNRDVGVASFLSTITLTISGQYLALLGLYRLKSATAEELAKELRKHRRTVQTWLTYYTRKGVLTQTTVGRTFHYRLADPLLVKFIDGIYKAYDETMKEFDEYVDRTK